MHLISDAGLKSSFTVECPTRARFVFTNGDGLSVTACPAHPNSADNSFVEIFSSGWDTLHEFKDTNPNAVKSISVEYIDPDEEDYQFTWFEMVPRVSLGLIGTFFDIFNSKIDLEEIQLIFFSSVLYCSRKLYVRMP